MTWYRLKKMKINQVVDDLVVFWRPKSTTDFGQIFLFVLVGERFSNVSVPQGLAISGCTTTTILGPHGTTIFHKQWKPVLHGIWRTF